MLGTLCLLTCALMPAQPGRGAEWLLTPRLSRAQELVYRGTFTEEAGGKGCQCTRSYRLESRVFIMDTTHQGAEAALYTTLRLRSQPAQAEEKPTATEPGSVRLELARINPQGRLTSSSGTSLLAPLSGPATIECGALVEVPNSRLGLNHTWDVAEEGRPPRTWTVAGTDTVAGTSCVKLLGVQQSEDWERPRADRTAWRRQDLVWLSPRQGIAQRVERTIELREPAREEVAQRLVARYELETSLVYPGQLFEDRAREIVQALKFSETAEPLCQEPGKYGPRAQETLLAKLRFHLENQPPTPYREAVLQVKRRVEAARLGQSPPASVPEATAIIPVAAVGKPAPDFIVPRLGVPGSRQESLRLQRFLGRALLLVFYNPASRNAEDLLRFAQDVQDKNPDKVVVLGLAVSDDVERVLGQYADLRLSFPLASGKGVRLTYGVDATPKLVVVDSEGVVRGAYVGWGHEIPQAILQDLKRWQSSRNE